MDLSTPKDDEKLFCPVRKEWVAAQPEEKVRQRLLTHLVEKLRFPISGIAVEKALDQMPHLKGQNVPDRRADIVCFAKGINPDYDLYPLLMIECKAVPLNDTVIQQVMGYNHYVRSVFVAVVNETDIQMVWFDPEKQENVSIPYLPDCDQLMRSLNLVVYKS